MPDMTIEEAVNVCLNVKKLKRVETSNTAVIECLRDLLGKAESGTLTKLCYVAIDGEEFSIGRTTSLEDAVYMANLMNFRFLRQMEA